ncbi:MAG TPA: hypothetical protein VLL06_07865 [Nitrospiraceae bacterium]|nr:hypothetical protein [Nitrospiraceae bacterium]
MLYGAWCLIVLASVQACSQPQQVNNPPCAASNAVIQVKPSADLSLQFGNDAIQIALDTITRHVRQNDITSTTELTGLGTDAAVRTAEANGKNLKPLDRAVLAAFLREDVVPAIKQSPTCGFMTVSTKRDVSIEDVYLENFGDKPIVKVKLSNTGQVGARFINVVVRNMIDGMKPQSGQADMVLSPGQWRNVSNPQATLPMSDIGSGKKALIVIVQLSYAKEAGSQPFVYQEEWKYDAPSQTFKQSPIK